MSNGADYLAIDLGASGGRVMRGRWDGARLELAELHRFANAPVRVQGHLHWDALRLWAEMCAGLAAHAAQTPHAPISIGVDTWAVDFALLDRAGRLLGNPYSYRDPRTEAAPPLVFARGVSRRQIFDVSGLQYRAIDTLYQLFWMRHTNDPQLEAAATLLMLPDLFNYWLTGRKAAEYTNATTTQFFDCRARRWATPLLEQLDLPTRILPEIVQPGTSLGALLPDLARAAGFKTPVMVVAPACHDTGSAVVAVPGLDEHSAYLSSGTWSLMGVEVAEPIINDAAYALNVTHEGGVAGSIRLQRNIAGLWLLQECRRVWARDGRSYGWDLLMDEAAQATPFVSIIDPDHTNFVSPADMPAAIRAYCRRTAQPEPESVGALMRCCLQSLALRYRWTRDALAALTGRALTTVRVVGGGSQNRLLCQLTADACGCAVVAGPVEATALGNILVQMIAGGLLPDVAAARQVVAASVALAHYEPQRSAAWDAAYERFTRLISMAATAMPGATAAMTAATAAMTATAAMAATAMPAATAMTTSTGAMAATAAPAAGAMMAGMAKNAPDKSGQKITILDIPKLIGIGYFAATTKGMAEAATELGNVDVKTDGPTEAKIDKQIEFIENYITQAPDAIVFAANDPVAISPVLKKALDAGIHVVGYDAGSQDDAREWFVNQATFEQIGKAMVDQMIKEVGEEADVAIVTSSLTAPNQNRWIEEMNKYIAASHPKLKVVATLPSEEDQQQAFKAAQDIMKTYPNVKGIFGLSSVAFPGAADGVKQAGNCGKVAIVGLSTPNQMRPFVKEGCVKSVVLWNPIDLGYATVYAVRAIVDGKLKPGATEFEAGKLGKLKVVGSEILLGDPFVYTQENIDKFDF